jgi:hypothetical protein
MHITAQEQLVTQRKKQEVSEITGNTPAQAAAQAAAHQVMMMTMTSHGKLFVPMMNDTMNHGMMMTQTLIDMENKTIEEILVNNSCSAHVLKNLVSPDGVPGNHYERLIKSIKEYASSQELKAITFCYTQDGIPCNKVVGIFTREQLDEVLEDIRDAIGKDKIVEDKFDETCDNYFIQFNDDYQSYFYSSNYTVGELNL